MEIDELCEEVHEWAKSKACIKCGSDALPEIKYCKGVTFGEMEMEEYLHKRCLVCGYKWKAPCNDKETK